MAAKSVAWSAPAASRSWWTTWPHSSGKGRRPGAADDQPEHGDGRHPAIDHEHGERAPLQIAEEGGHGNEAADRGRGHAHREGSGADVSGEAVGDEIDALLQAGAGDHGD